MHAQRAAIAEALEGAGWRVELRESGSAWWEMEVWTLRSTWSPVEATCVLTFVAPPDPHPPGATGWGVNVVASGRRLTERGFAGLASLYLGRGWEKHLPAFVERIAVLRDATE